MSTEWTWRRSVLNHRRLKNGFLNRLSAFRLVVSGTAHDDQLVDEFVRDELPRWCELSVEARALIESYPREISIAHRFDVPPLSRVDETTRGWLLPISDRLDRSGHGIDDLLDQAREKLNAADRASHTLKSVLAGSFRDQLGQPKTPLAEATLTFEDACKALTDALSAFPNRIRPT